MNLEEITRALLASYETDGGINHLEGTNLPSQESLNKLCVELMYLLFPGFFEATPLTTQSVAAVTSRRIQLIHSQLVTEIEKSLRFEKHPSPAAQAEQHAINFLKALPDLRQRVKTDVSAAYDGDPAARSIEEIILSYPCVLVISLQRIAHVLYKMGIALLPRMITEFAHERTGTDIHPGAEIGTHFFIDHCTGVVIGETARIGNHVKIYQGVTLGAKSFVTDERGLPVKGVRRHPKLEDHVIVYPGATILGGDTIIGQHSIVGSNVWLMQSMPPHSIAYYQGDQASIIRPRRSREALLEDVGDWVI
ncbi:MAG: serine acetyltransferase [Opitutaceae bacterium]|nr:serine acetyltransferase [Opitutaceae bacterium]